MSSAGHGGRREGAGRKPGPSWKGPGPKPPSVRQLGREKVTAVLATSNDPISTLLEIANDPGNDVYVRLQAAIGAAPYCYPKLSACVVAQASPSASRDTAQMIADMSAKIARLKPRTETPGVTIDAEFQPAAQVAS